MHKNILLFSGISGLLMVAGGALGAHALKSILDINHMQVFDTAVKYQAYHTLALLGIAFLTVQTPSKLAEKAGLFFMAGILLFSGSLYFLACRPLLGISEEGFKWVGMFTPLGGLAFMSGWFCIVLVALKQKK